MNKDLKLIIRCNRIMTQSFDEMCDEIIGEDYIPNDFTLLDKTCRAQRRINTRNKYNQRKNDFNNICSNSRDDFDDISSRVIGGLKNHSMLDHSSTGRAYNTMSKNKRYHIDDTRSRFNAEPCYEYKPIDDEYDELVSKSSMLWKEARTLYELAGNEEDKFVAKSIEQAAEALHEAVDNIDYSLLMTYGKY